MSKGRFYIIPADIWTSVIYLIGLANLEPLIHWMLSMISFHVSARAVISLMTLFTVVTGIVKTIEPGISSSIIGAFVEDIISLNSSFVVSPVIILKCIQASQCQFLYLPWMKYGISITPSIVISKEPASPTIT